MVLSHLTRPHNVGNLIQQGFLTLIRGSQDRIRVDLSPVRVRTRSLRA